MKPTSSGCPAILLLLLLPPPLLLLLLLLLLGDAGVSESRDRQEPRNPQGTRSPDKTCEAPNMKSTSSGCPVILLLFTAPITPSLCGTFPTLLLLSPPGTLLLLLLLLLVVVVVGKAGVGDWGSEARVEAAHSRLDSSSAVMLDACGASCCMMALKAWLC
jgi:hypothetical protein